MHIVALTRWNQARVLEQELPALAQAIGLGLYDARLRLVAPPPSILAQNLTLERAQALLGLLHTHGHGAVAADLTSVPTSRTTLVAHAFELGPAELVAIDEANRRVPLPFAQMIGVVRAIEVSSQSQTTSTTEKKLAIGTAVLTGGLKMNKQVTKVEKSESAERQRVAYVFSSAGPAPLLFKEQLLRYDGLGARRGTTVHQSFEALTAELRRCAPQALHDDRLLAHRRYGEAVAVRGTTNDRAVATTNASANDLAAYILMLAHLQQQL
jgi:hypothetical protein